MNVRVRLLDTPLKTTLHPSVTEVVFQKGVVTLFYDDDADGDEYALAEVLDVRVDVFGADP